MAGMQSQVLVGINPYQCESLRNQNSLDMLYPCYTIIKNLNGTISP